MRRSGVSPSSSVITVNAVLSPCEIRSTSARVVQRKSVPIGGVQIGSKVSRRSQPSEVGLDQDNGGFNEKIRCIGSSSLPLGLRGITF